MEELRLGVVESQFAEIIWSNEPLPSGELVKLCEQKLGWKKSTTYTVLKRLCERGIFQSEKGMVSARMTKEEYDAAQSEKFVEENFGGSLPAFLAAFTTRKKLNKSEVDEIKKMIDAILLAGVHSVLPGH
ncbi:MAG: BlaI/MecI/CopY family transcriptional regulator [Roseburia inulinivorans]